MAVEQNTSKSAQSKTKGEKRRFSFHLTMTGIVCSLTVLVLGMVWVFIFGVLVGRGYQPEASMPELARIMPQASAPSNATQVPPAPQPVLKAEELNFSKRLKAKAETPGANKSEPESRAAKAAPKKTVQKKAVAPEQHAQKISKAVAEEQPKAGSFVYVYQCASFRKLARARDLEHRIDARGLNAGIESSDVSGKTWHRVLVHFTGRPKDTEHLKQTLRTVGVKKPIMRSKKPI